MMPKHQQCISVSSILSINLKHNINLKDNMAAFGYLSAGLSLLLSSGMALSKSGMQFSVITVDFFHWANQFFMLQYCSFCTQLNRMDITVLFFFFFFLMTYFTSEK